MRLFLALIICSATPLAAETRQHGNLVYDIPSGWVRARFGPMAPGSCAPNWRGGMQILRDSSPPARGRAAGSTSGSPPSHAALSRKIRTIPPRSRR